MAKTTSTALQRGRNKATLDASTRLFTDRLPQIKNKRKNAHDGDDIARPPPKRQATQDKRVEGMTKQPGEAGSAVENAIQKAGGGSQREGEVARPADLDILDSHDDEETGDEVSALQGKESDGDRETAEQTRSPVWQHEMPNTEEKELEQIVEKARKTTGRALRSSDPKKPGNEATDKGAAGGEKGESGKSCGQATGKTTGAANGEGSSRGLKATSGPTNKGKGKAFDKSPGKGKKKSDDSDDPPRRAPPNNPKDRRQNTTTGFPIKRILAERSVNGKREYLVDWLPTWTTAKTARGGKDEVMTEWQELITDNKTIQAGDNHKLKIENPTNDDSIEQMQLMMDEVMLSFIRYMNEPVPIMTAEFFHEDEWQFLGSIQERDAKKVAARDATRADKNPSAAEVMRRAYVDMRANYTSANSRGYGRIVVQWLGKIDPDAHDHVGQPQHGQTARAFLAPILQDKLSSDEYMRVHRWDVEPPQNHVGPLRECVHQLVQYSPFLLTKRWPRMFISMFFEASEIRDMLSKPNSDPNFDQLHFLDKTEAPDAEPDNDSDEDGDNGIVANDGWENRIRDDFIYAYMAERDWEKRSMESVNITFVACGIWLQSEWKAWQESDEANEGGKGEGPSSTQTKEKAASKMHREDEDNDGWLKKTRRVMLKTVLVKRRSTSNCLVEGKKTRGR